MYNVRYSTEFSEMITFIKRMFESHIKTKSKIRQQLFERFALYTDLIVKIGSLMYIGAIFMFLVSI